MISGYHIKQHKVECKVHMMTPSPSGEKIEKFGNREGNYKWFGFPGVWEAEK